MNSVSLSKRHEADGRMRVHTASRRRNRYWNSCYKHTEPAAMGEPSSPSAGLLFALSLRGMEHSLQEMAWKIALEDNDELGPTHSLHDMSRSGKDCWFFRRPRSGSLHATSSYIQRNSWNGTHVCSRIDCMIYIYIYFLFFLYFWKLFLIFFWGGRLEITHF